MHGNSNIKYILFTFVPHITLLFSQKFAIQGLTRIVSDKHRHTTALNSPKPKAQVRQSVNCRTQVRKHWVRRPKTWTRTYYFTGIENMSCCCIRSQMYCWHALVPLKLSGWVLTAKNTLSEYVILLLFHCKYGCTDARQCYIPCLAFDKACSEYDTLIYLSKAWSKLVHIFSSYWIIWKHVLQRSSTPAFLFLT